MALAGRTPGPQIHGSPCSVKVALDNLPAGEADALSAMLADPGWNDTQIFDALEDEGIKVGKQTVGRHRRGNCRCRSDAR